MFIETEAEMTERTMKARWQYADGFYKVLEDRRKIYTEIRENYIDPKKCSENRNKYRDDFASILGWPLTEYDSLSKTPMAVKKEYRYDTGYAEAYAMEFEVLPGLWFYGLYLESKNKGEKLPFIITQHGGCGNPESASETFEENNYNGMVRRTSVFGKGSNLFAPMLFLWPDRFHPEPREKEDEGYSRYRIDARLRQVGSSISAVECFAIRRTLDYFIKEGIAETGHIGMLGLSYGGFFSMITGALDTRIDAVYSSCQLNDRYRYGREDWIWSSESSKFLDAEITGLIAPRRFFAEEGVDDDLFDSGSFLKEAERVKTYFDAAGAGDNYRFRTFPGTHEFAKDDEGIAFIYDYIKY